MQLELGPCQGYMGLQYHMEDALKEKRLDPKDATYVPPLAIFSNKYCNEIDALDGNKIYDYCFIGSINSYYERRVWVIEFAKKYFTSKSIFINTDNNKDWQSLGVFDYSSRDLGYCPKSQPDNQSRAVQYRVVSKNIYYFTFMRRSKFILCPAGDAPWSFRFYETLMCKSIPIVESWHHTYRTKEEAEIKYNYFLSTDLTTPNINEFYYQNLVKQNTELFKKYHMLT